MRVWFVFPCWRTSPLTRSCIGSSCMSGTSSRVTIQGPMGQNVSMAFENEKTPDSISLRWMSRAEMSLNTVKPAM
ncbi:hypothetical protein D3C73_1553720 [compost metagenome]